MNEFYKNIRVDFIHQAISILAVAMRVCFNSITDPAADFIFLIPRLKIFIVCLKRTLLMGLVSFSMDTMNLVNIYSKQCKQIMSKKSLVMMQMLFIFGPYDKIFLLVIL